DGGDRPARQEAVRHGQHQHRKRRGSPSQERGELRGTVAVAVQAVNDRGLIFGGEVIHRGDLREVRSPADGSLVAHYVPATAADVDRAVAEARQQGRTWMRLHPDERARVLRAAAEAIRAHVDDIAEMLAREQGKPVAVSVKVSLLGGPVFDHYGEAARRAPRSS